jgi:hypothetical protein
MKCEGARMRSPIPAQAGTLLGVGLDDIVYALRSARKSVAIATPFLSHAVAALLVRESMAIPSRRLLIALNDVAVEGGYLDPRGVAEFIAGGFEIRSLRNLHAKVVATDQRWGLVGSGNLTTAGSNGGNAELGIVLDSRQARHAVADHFDQWWAAADPLDVRRLRSLNHRRRPAAPERRQRAGQGGLYKIDPGVELEAFVDDAARGGYWLKIMHHRPERERISNWRGDFWISDVHRLRPADGEPLLKPSYRLGDRLVIYLSREGRRACPAIVRVTRLPHYDPALVRRDGRPDDYKSWSWVTEVTGERVAAIDKAPTLADLNINPASIRQHSRIRLTHRQFQRALAAIPNR